MKLREDHKKKIGNIVCGIQTWPYESPVFYLAIWDRIMLPVNSVPPYFAVNRPWPFLENEARVTLHSDHRIAFTKYDAIQGVSGYFQITAVASASFKTQSSRGVVTARGEFRTLCAKLRLTLKWTLACTRGRPTLISQVRPFWLHRAFLSVIAIVCDTLLSLIHIWRCRRR